MTKYNISRKQQQEIVRNAKDAKSNASATAQNENRENLLLLFSHRIN